MGDWLNGGLLQERVFGALTSSWATVLPLLIVLLLGLMLRRSVRRRDDDYDPSADRFAPTAPISEDQMALLHYLQRAFPHEAVLFQPSLSRFMMVRKGRNRHKAHAKLARLRVDFLVCSEDGQPWMAFDTDQRLRDGVEDGQRLLEEKSAMLKTAGIRLIRLRGDLQDALPPPAEMRARWEASAAAPLPGTARARGTHESVPPTEWARTGFQASRAADLGAPRHRQALSAYEGHRPASVRHTGPGDAWSDVLKRA